MISASKLQIDTTASALDMAQAMFGNGIAIVDASYTGAGRASGLYSGGDETAAQLTPSDSGVILSTGRADSVTNASGDANVRSNTSTSNRTSGDSDLDDLAGVRTYDAAVFEADFIPQGETLTMQVVFSSEEYLEYVGSGFNDAVGIWVNGQQAELTVGTGDITINNINDESNQNLYVDNPSASEVANTEMDGFTLTLTLKAPVQAGSVNSIKIGIADGGDRYFDSNLLIAGDSIQTALVAGDDSTEIAGTGTETLDVLANDSSSGGGSLTITHINGTAVNAGSTVVLSSGETVTLNADGSFDITSDGDEGSSVFSYSVADEDGNTDTAFVTVTTTPCFVAGTLIDTDIGPRRVEHLRPGDQVWTLDRGFQPLRWIGTTTRHAIGTDAPVEFSQNTLGTHERVLFSPNHRVLLRSPLAELYFAASETLVRAADLVNGTTVRRVTDGGPVCYVHLLFDQHEIVLSNGMLSESYHPGVLTLNGYDAAVQAEVLSLFPDLKEMSELDYGPTARRVLRRFEAELCLAG
ncbi:MAG: choice-of-anchor L domain-containing protein [Rhodobacteraceae bacterium]|nr:choice-of-anchor L domain-containing protein [Paracoccaceae bacterium]